MAIMKYGATYAAYTAHIEISSMIAARADEVAAIRETDPAALATLSTEGALFSLAGTVLEHAIRMARVMGITPDQARADIARADEHNKPDPARALAILENATRREEAAQTNEATPKPARPAPYDLSKIATL